MLKKLMSKYKSLIVFAAALPISTQAHADLIGMINNGKSVIIAVFSLLNVGAGMLGAYYVITGVMNWKKSSGEQGRQMESKEIITPIIAGIILLSISGFIMMTSSTFGLASSTVNNLN